MEKCIKPNGKMYQTKWKNVSNQMEKCIKPNEKIEFINN
jgi:hypothetical protein